MRSHLAAQPRQHITLNSHALDNVQAPEPQRFPPEAWVLAWQRDWWGTYWELYRAVCTIFVNLYVVGLCLAGQ